MSEIDALMTENRRFPPPPAFRAQARVRDSTLSASAADNPEAYWAGQARTLEWIKPFTTTLEWDPPHAKWFADGT